MGKLFSLIKPWTPSPNEGEVTVHDYRITVYPSIGQGSFGVVCKAFNKRSKLNVAAKGIRFEVQGEVVDDVKVMALVEAENMKLISHENIIKLYDVHNHKGTFWLFMEHCHLGDLSKYLFGNADIGFDAKLKLMSEITSAIFYLHKHTPPIIHRDIKPENVLLATSGGIVTAKLTDFGFAKLYDNTLSQIGSKFYTKMNESLKGSPMYMAPEFYMEDESSLKYTATVDIFSLGLLHAVIMDYGPENKTTFPLSVSRREIKRGETKRRENKEDIFGFEMAEAYKSNKTLPVIVEKKETDDDSTEQLKGLILHMTDFHSSGRCSIDKVHSVIASVKENAATKECQMSPDDTNATGVIPKAPEDFVPRQISAELPSPKTPAMSKPFRDIFDFKDVDSHALTVSKEEHKSFRDLIWHLIYSRDINNELEKARAIFEWLCSKDLTELHFDDVAEGSSEEMLLNLKKGKTNYAVVFQTLCSYAGLQCHVIAGHSKAAGYKPGVKVSDEDRHSWNGVFVEGTWRLIDCNWAARRLSTNDLMRYEIDEFYFMPDPDQFIFSHFPDDPRWQLLNPTVTRDDFENLVRVRSSFFKYGLEIMSHRQAVIQTEAEVCVRIAYNPARKGALVFTFRLQHEADVHEDKEATLGKYGMHEIVGNVAACTIRPPKAGRYSFNIYARNPKENNYKSVCEYILVCEEHIENQMPFPPCAQKNWGPRPGLYEYNMFPMQLGAKFNTVQGQAEVTFKIPKGLRFTTELKSHNFEESQLQRYIMQREVADMLKVTFYAPAQGEYGLEIYARDPEKGGTTLTHVCQYLITCSESVPPAEPLPVLALGPKPLCVTLGLTAASHIDPFIQSEQGEDVIELDMEKPLRMTSKLVYVSKDQNDNCADYILQQSREKQVFFELKLPKTGMYTLQLYALEHDDAKKTFPEVFSYLIHCTTATSSPGVYPKQFREWKFNCYLYSPKEGHLTPSISSEKNSSSQESVWFKMDVPQAHAVVVVVGEDWTELAQTTPEGTWEGEVSMDKHWGHQNKAAVLAQFDADGTSYKTLLEYTM